MEFLDTHLFKDILLFADFVKSLATTRTNQPTNKRTNTWVNINYKKNRLCKCGILKNIVMVKGNLIQNVPELTTT